MKRSYHLLVATRKTGGGDFGQWQKWYKKLGEEISQLSNIGQTLIEILSGKQMTLT